MDDPTSPVFVPEGATHVALMALMRIIATDVTDDSVINDALGAVLGADSESGAPAASVPPSSRPGRASDAAEGEPTPFDCVMPLPPDTPGISAEDSIDTAPLTAVSPLEFAVVRRNHTVVKSLLRAGARADYIGGLSCSCLCKCCYSAPSSLDIIRTLLAAGANPDATTNNDTNSASCLIISVVKNNVPAVEALLEYGADISYEWKGSNALSMALDFKKLDIAEIFENFEFRKAQNNRWQRYQQRRQKEEERRNAASKSPPPNRATPPPPATPARSTSNPPSAQRTPDRSPLTQSPKAGASPAPPTPPRQPTSAVAVAKGESPGGQAMGRMTEQLTAMDWVVPIDDLDVGQAISAGAHGEVFRGAIRSTGDAVAIKRFPCLDSKGRECFRREVELLVKFRHENIVLFKGAVIEPEFCALLTELCAESLYQRLQRAEPLPFPVRVRWARDIAKGMTYLHARSPPVVHRDLKSLNVLLDRTGTIKLCDFGIARLREHTFIATQHIAGSPSWMAPEVLRGDDFDHTSDVYAFGVLMWELLTRQIPWPNKTMAQLVGLVGFSGAVLEPPKQLPVECPRRYVELMQMCFKPAAERPTFRELREELDRVMVGVD